MTFLGVWYDCHRIIDRKGNFLLSVAACYDSAPEKNEKIDNICRNLVGIKANLGEVPDYPLAPVGHQSETSYEVSLQTIT